ncbi:MAG: hypothetical protein BAJATHORv1_40174 [Candidatus Thorarchaeota archaeon]|nr:MAG: hypothetical protein BAJATHORv1_40174 [Candidatus Thorarchaeota archaeon]
MHKVQLMKSSIDDIQERVLSLLAIDEDEEAEGILDPALSSNPQNPQLLTLDAILILRRGREKAAESRLWKIVEMDPSNELAVYTLGSILNSQLRVEAVEQLYKNTLEKHPDSHQVMDDLCRFLYEEDRAEEAFKLAGAHRKRFPKVYEAYDAIRFLLHSVEDSLMGDVEDTDGDTGYLNMLLSNLVEQADLILEMEKQVGREKLESLNVAWEIDEELLRIAGELEHYKQVAKVVGLNLPTSLDSHIDEIIKIGRSRSNLD